MIDFRPATRPGIKEGEVAVFVESIVEALRVQGVFVEIGVCEAKSTAAVLETLAALGHARRLYSIDPLASARDAHEAATHGVPAGVRPIFRQALSWDVAPEFEEPIAWLFVDGCHCEHCALKDMTDWAPKIVLGGIMLLHDTGPNLGRRARGHCFRSGKVERAGVDRALARCGVVRREFALLSAAEGGALVGIRSYRRMVEGPRNRRTTQ